MKKTYAESWFVNCQPGSQLMNDLTKPNASLSDTPIKILQAEVITKDYLLFEVISEEHYAQYNSGLADVSKLKEELESIKEELDTTTMDLDTCRDELRSQRRLVDELETFNSTISGKYDSLKRQVGFLGELTKCKDDFGNDVMFLRETEIDSSLYAELKGLYLDTDNSYLIDESDGDY